MQHKWRKWIEYHRTRNDEKHSLCMCNTSSAHCNAIANASKFEPNKCENIA